MYTTTQDCTADVYHGFCGGGAWIWGSANAPTSLKKYRAIWGIAATESQHRTIYIYMAKASFSAYVLGKHLLKTGEKVQFSTKKNTTNFGLPFCFFPSPFFASKWLKYAVFAFQKAKNVGRKRGQVNGSNAMFVLE